MAHGTGGRAGGGRGRGSFACSDPCPGRSCRTQCRLLTPPLPTPPPVPQALVQLEYPDNLQRLLLTPQREVLVELVITRDSGEIETFNAYRVQHDDSRGPFKGGLRYHPQVDLDDVRSLASLSEKWRKDNGGLERSRRV